MQSESPPTKSDLVVFLPPNMLISLQNWQLMVRTDKEQTSRKFPNFPHREGPAYGKL